jgi:hypothetical protein
MNVRNEGKKEKEKTTVEARVRPQFCAGCIAVTHNVPVMIRKRSYLYKRMLIRSMTPRLCEKHGRKQIDYVKRISIADQSSSSSFSVEADEADNGLIGSLICVHSRRERLRDYQRTATISEAAFAHFSWMARWPVQVNCTITNGMGTVTGAYLLVT